MSLQFHKKDGSINWNLWYWIIWAGLAIPLLIINLWLKSDIISKVQSGVLLFAVIFLILDMIQFSRKSRAWNHIWKEEMEIMKDFGWSQDPKKVKRLEELREERKRHE